MVSVRSTPPTATSSSGAGNGSGAKGGVYINSKWAYNLTGTYQIPVIETNFGMNLSGRQGYPIPYVFRVTATGNNGQSSSNTKYLLAEGDPAQFRHPNITELDLRLAKDIRVYRGGALTLSIDAFNILDNRTILQRDVTRLNSNNTGSPFATSNRITEMQSPRVFRLGARVSF